jgi:hypothetical protein
MLLKGIGFADREAILRGILGFSWRDEGCAGRSVRQTLTD